MSATAEKLLLPLLVLVVVLNVLCSWWGPGADPWMLR
jgi:hypothetical protein